MNVAITIELSVRVEQQFPTSLNAPDVEQGLGWIVDIRNIMCKSRTKNCRAWTFLVTTNIQQVLSGQLVRNLNTASS